MTTAPDVLGIATLAYRADQGGDLAAMHAALTPETVIAITGELLAAHMVVGAVRECLAATADKDRKALWKRVGLAMMSCSAGRDHR